MELPRNWKPSDSTEIPQNVIPAGWQLVRATDEDDASGEDWSGISVSFELLQGEYAGKTVRKKFKLRHANKNLQDKAWVHLSQTFMAAGITEPKGTEEIQGKDFYVYVSIFEADSGKKYNFVGDWQRDEVPDGSDRVGKMKIQSLAEYAEENNTTSGDAAPWEQGGKL